MDKKDKGKKAPLNNVLASMQQLQRDAEDRTQKRLWKEISLPQSYEELLQQLSKDELNLISRHYGLKNISSLKKNDLIAHLADLLPRLLESELLLMDEHRYLFLKQFINENDRVIRVVEADSYSNKLTEYWRATGLIFSGSVKGRKILFMPNEIHSAFQALDHQPLQKTLQRNTEWILLTQGMLFYYGVLGYQQILTQLEELMGSRPDYLELHDILLRANEYYNMMNMDSYGHWAYLDVQDIDYVLNEHRARPKVDFFKFSKSKLLKAGQPNYRDENQAFRRLSGFLFEHYGITEEDAKEITHACQYIVNVSLKPTAIIDFLGTKVNFPSFESVQQLIDEVMYFSNYTRQWGLKGHAPDELFTGEKKSLSPLPVNAPLPFAAPLAQPVKGFPGQSRSTNVIDLKTHQKIGRNDPCPCGSGKKFKQCCGKNN